MPLDGQQLDFYWTHGYLPLPDLFPARSAAALRQRLDELSAAWPAHSEERRDLPGRRASTDVRTLSDVAKEDSLFYAHARSPQLLDIVEQLLDLPISLYGDLALLSPPHSRSEQPEERDEAALQIEPPGHVLTCWTALDDLDAERGCPHYYPGSHAARPQAGAAAGGETRERFDRASSHAVPLRAGSCVLHHARTVHWRPANRSPDWSRAFVSYYVRSDAVMRGRGRNSPPLLEMRA